jgi:hypothetical protein
MKIGWIQSEYRRQFLITNTLVPQYQQFGIPRRESRQDRSRTDLLRIYKGFARIARLMPQHKRFIARLWPRVLRLSRRRPKYARVWNRPGEPVF